MGEALSVHAVRASHKRTHCSAGQNMEVRLLPGPPPDLNNFVILIDVALPSALTDIDTTLIWMGLALRVFVVAFKAIVH